MENIRSKAIKTALGFLKSGLILMLFLPSCSDIKSPDWSFPSFGGSKGARNATAKSKLIKNVTVLDDKLKINAPDKYCIDKSGLISQPDFAFIPMAACAAVTRNVADQAPQSPAVINLTLKAAKPHADLGWPADHSSFNDQVRAMMTWSGKAKDAKIISSEKRGDILFVEVEDQSKFRPNNLSKKSFRAFFKGDGFIGTLCMTGSKKRALSKAKAYDFQQALIDDLLKPSLINRILATRTSDFVADPRKLNYLYTHNTTHRDQKHGDQIGQTYVF